MCVRTGKNVIRRFGAAGTREIGNLSFETGPDALIATKAALFFFRG